MEDLSNGGIIGGLISLLIGSVGAVFGLYKNSEATRDKERIESMRQLLASKAESEEKLKGSYEARIVYQEHLIDNYRTDLEELQKKYFELGSTLQPALQMTNKTLEDVSKIIAKITSKEIN